jgi:hypothetical protein
MIKIDPPNFRVTAYGEVDAEALEALRASYDTRTLLALVDRLDRLRPLFAAGGLRDKVLRLHAMAHTVLNGAPLSIPAEETDISVSAEDLLQELSAVIEALEVVVDTVRPLTDLAPGQQNDG